MVINLSSCSDGVFQEKQNTHDSEQKTDVSKGSKDKPKKIKKIVKTIDIPKPKFEPPVNKPTSNKKPLIVVLYQYEKYIEDNFKPMLEQVRKNQQDEFIWK